MTAEIREHREADALVVNESALPFGIVIGNRIELDAGRFELRMRVAQLPELRPTRRSPDRGAKEHDDCTGVAAIGMKVELRAARRRIRQAEVRQALADNGARGVAVFQTESSDVAQWCGGVEA
jgi:hypothetical protein